MAEKAFTGLTASITVGGTITEGTGAVTGGTVLGYVSGVDLDIDKDIIEIISLGSKWKEKVPSIRDWTGAIDGTCALATGGSQETLYNAFDEDTLIVIQVLLDTTTYFAGSCYVKNMKISVKADDKIGLTADLSGSGGLFLTLPAAGG